MNQRLVHKPMIHSQKCWQEIAWDSINLQLPADWHPTVILKSYLHFEEDGNPVCEIKWQQTKGAFSPDGVLNRFHKTLGRDVSIKAWPAPDVWQQACHSFIVSGFQLQQKDADHSHGVLLHCPRCQRTILLRFYREPAALKETVRHILQSLSDHSEKEEQLWSIFDIRAWLPVQAELQSQEFLPGRFNLTFTCDGATITLYRFRPGAAILKNQSLAAFGTALGGRNSPIVEDDNRVQFADHATGLDRLRTKLRRKPSWHWLQLRYLPGPNVILGVQGKGRKGENIAMLKYISDHYTVEEPLQGL